MKYESNTLHMNYEMWAGNLIIYRADTRQIQTERTEKRVNQFSACWSFRQLIRDGSGNHDVVP